MFRQIIKQRSRFVTYSLDITSAVGHNEGILLERIVHWVQCNEQRKNPTCFRDDCWWMFHTYEQWRQNVFPNLSERTVGRIVKTLEDLHLINTTDRYNDKPDCTRKWYSPNWEYLEYFFDLWDEAGRPVAPDYGSDDHYDAFLATWLLFYESSWGDTPSDENPPEDETSPSDDDPPDKLVCGFDHPHDKLAAGDWTNWPLARTEPPDKLAAEIKKYTEEKEEEKENITPFGGITPLPGAGTADAVISTDSGRKEDDHFSVQDSPVPDEAANKKSIDSDSESAENVGVAESKTTSGAAAENVIDCEKAGVLHMLIGEVGRLGGNLYRFHGKGNYECLTGENKGLMCNMYGKRHTTTRSVPTSRQIPLPDDESPQDRQSSSPLELCIVQILNTVLKNSAKRFNQTDRATLHKVLGNVPKGQPKTFEEAYAQDPIGLEQWLMDEAEAMDDVRNKAEKPYRISKTAYIDRIRSDYAYYLDRKQQNEKTAAAKPKDIFEEARERQGAVVSQMLEERMGPDEFGVKW